MILPTQDILWFPISPHPFLTPSSASSSSWGSMCSMGLCSLQMCKPEHSCSTPLLHHRSSGQAADAGMMNRGFSLAAAGSLPPARLPGPARCAKNQCHEAQGRPGSSWHEDGHELWMCWPTLGAEGTSLHRNHGLCPTDLTDTRLDKSTLCSLNTAPWGHSQEGAVLPRSPGCGEARGAVETCGRGEAHQGSCSWNSCPHIQELARGGSPAVGRLCSVSGTQRSFGSHRPAAPRDALVLSLHHPCHRWCCPEPAPLREQGGKAE